MTAYLARTVCRSRAYAWVAAGRLLPGGAPAAAACTDTALHLLVASAGAQEGEGQLEVICEQALFAGARALAVVPAPNVEQDLLLLLSGSGCLSLLRFDAALGRLVAVQQLALPPELPGDPFRLLVVHPRGLAVAAATCLGTVCLAVRLPAAPAGSGGSSGDGALFGPPSTLALPRHVRSLAFTADDGDSGPAAAPAPAAAAAGTSQQPWFGLAALHQHPRRRYGTGMQYVVVEYRCCAAAAQPGAGPGQLRVRAFLPITTDSPRITSTSLGLPRALVPPALGAPAGAPLLVLHEWGLQLLGGRTAGVDADEQALRWWGPLPGKAADTGSGEPAPQAAAAAVGEHSGGPEPMALSNQPSAEQLPDAMPCEGSDEEMSDAGQPAPASEAAEARLSLNEAQQFTPEAWAAVAESAVAAEARQLVSCCCWEWQQPAAGQAEQAPALVCALESGSLWRPELPSIGSQGGGAFSVGLPTPDADGPRQRQSPPLVVQPARSLAALPGDLLLCCTDTVGLQLLRRAPAGGPEGGAYEALLPPFLAAQQQQLAGWDAPAGPGCATLPAAAAVVDCLAADLEGCGQAQVYAACRSTEGDGSLAVLYPDPKPEPVFELPGAAEGITGLWGLRRCPGGRFHSLALLSYLGGSRLLAVQGGVFRDVTECYPLQVAAQTLAAGSLLAPGGAGAAAPAAEAAAAATVIAQVTYAGVFLFAPEPSAAPLSRQGSGSLGDSAGSGASPAWQPLPGSSIGAAVVTEHTVLLSCTGTTRQLVALLPAAGPGEQPQLVAAARLPLAADVSCLSGALAQPPQQGQEHSAVFAVGTYASAVQLVQLAWDERQAGKGATLCLLASVDLTASSIAGSLAPAAAAAAAAATPLSPRAFQREQLTPESLLLLPAPAHVEDNSSSSGSSSGGNGGPAAAAAAAATLLVGLRTGSLLQLQCGWGERAQQEELLAVSVGSMPVVLLPLPPQRVSAAAAAAGALPPAAVALTDRALLLHPAPSAAAGGGRVRCQQLALPGVQAAAALLLDGDSRTGSSLMLDSLPEAAQLEAGAGSQAQQEQEQPQLFLLCAASDGCLRMVSLDPLQLASSARCLPLPQLLQPSRLALHAASGALVVGGSKLTPRRRRSWMPLPGEEDEEEEAAVQLIDPAAGELLASYAGFMPYEAITALAVWHPRPHPPPTPGSGSSLLERASSAGGAEAAPADAAARGSEASGSLRLRPVAVSPESEPTAAAAAAAAAAGAAAAASGEEEGPFVVVGTSIPRPLDFPEQSCWDDECSVTLQGRVLLLQVATATAASARAAGAPPAWEPSPNQPPRRQLQLLPVAEVHLPSRVLALCPGSANLTGSSAGAGAPRLFASVGRRLVSFEWCPRQQLLRRLQWVPTRRPVCSLQISEGLLAASDRREGVTLYRYFEPKPQADGAGAAQRVERGRLARRYRLAPPGAAELRHRLGLHHVLQRGALHAARAGGEGGLPEEEPDLGFTALAGDACCRAAVGGLALPPAPGAAASGPSSSAGTVPAAAAAVLDTSGQLAVLQQRWPGAEPTLHQRCVFRLGEPAVALLPASLAYSGDGGGSLASALAAAAQPGSAADMVAVTAGGAMVALQPLPQDEARQLLALQRALAVHPAAVPLGGGSHAAFRGPDSGPAPPPPLTFRHPPPPGVDPAAAVDLLALLASTASPATAAAAAAAGPAAADREARLAAEPAPPQPMGEPQVAAAGPSSSSVQSPAALKPAAAPPEVDAILDGDLLKAFLLLPPAAQRSLVAGAGGGSSGIDASDPCLAACRLTSLVARLVL